MVQALQEGRVSLNERRKNFPGFGWGFFLYPVDTLRVSNIVDFFRISAKLVKSAQKCNFCTQN